MVSGNCPTGPLGKPKVFQEVFNETNDDRSLEFHYLGCNRHTGNALMTDITTTGTTIIRVTATTIMAIGDPGTSGTDTPGDISIFIDTEDIIMKADI